MGGLGGTVCGNGGVRWPVVVRRVAAPFEEDGGAGLEADRGWLVKGRSVSGLTCDGLRAGMEGL